MASSSSIAQIRVARWLVKKKPSLPVSSASCVPEESQLQLPKISSNPVVHRWNPSLPDSRSQVPNEDVERKFQHLASSVHKMGMVLDSVQNDCMQLNRAMKEASLDSGSIQHTTTPDSPQRAHGPGETNSQHNLYPSTWTFSATAGFFAL